MVQKAKRYVLDTHVRIKDDTLASLIKDRAKRGSRTIPMEIERSLRIAYKMGVSDDDRPA